jgi:cyclin-dependent kinase-like
LFGIGLELLITIGYYGPEVDYWAIGCIMGEMADSDPMFQGDNEIDQLNVIQVIGRFPDFQYKQFYSNPHFNKKMLNCWR